MDKIKIYLAAPWIYRDRAVEAKREFEAAGFTVTSRWIEDHQDVPKDSENKDYLLQKQAVEDLEDIVEANVFVLMTLTKSEGKATELGFAYAMGIPCLIVDIPTDVPSNNIFYRLPGVYAVDSVENAVKGLSAMRDKVVGIGTAN